MSTIINGECLEQLKLLNDESADSLVTDPPAGIAFMGKNWDKNKGGRDAWVSWMTDIMRECYRVLKPGAHGLVWALPRTSHWTATALEDAGFEVRDVVTHLFGTGFPKSLNVGLAVDKASGTPNRGKATLNIKGQMTERDDRDYTVKGVAYEPATDAAKQWQGWGTALKPASEHWILIRKPLGEKTVAANVLRHGTGAMNVDGCRIAGHNSSIDRRATARKTGHSPTSPGEMSDTKWINRTTPEVYAQDRLSEHLGRFPANLVLSHNPDCGASCTEGCAVAELDKQSGVTKSGGGDKGNRPGVKGIFGRATSAGFSHEYKPDTGGASRFFYCAKASRSDRGDDNTHPTVKSTKLMRYLCRLVTPSGGTVLDPFMGSGSTGIAAVAEGFNFVGIEQEQEYYEVAKKRLLKGA